MRRITACVVLGTLGLGLVGCGVGAEERESAARTAAVAFTAAVRASDTGRACEALAPGTREEVETDGPCPTALATALGEAPADAPAGDPLVVDVYGQQARVVFEEYSVYRASFPDGWKVTAAGCTPRPGRPASCPVRGN
ncbi:hypothetical protein ACWFR1_07155 [Streptomyces sp. NPDC055103]